MTDSVDALLPILAEGLQPVLVDAVTAARAARDDVRSAHHEDGMDEIHQQLVINRAKIERLEAITSTLGLMKARSGSAVAAKRASYDDAYMHSATKKSVGFSDYASAKEKDAHAALGTIAETMELRKAENAHRDIDAAWDYCRILLRGAEGVQRDMELRIRMISLRSQLER